MVKVFYPTRIIGIVMVVLSLLHLMNVYHNFRINIFSFSIGLLIGATLFLIGICYLLRVTQKNEIHEDYILYKNMFEKPVLWKWEDIELFASNSRLRFLAYQIGKKEGKLKLLNFFGYLEKDLYYEIVSRAPNAYFDKKVLGKTKRC
jgi:hypothetical protein